MDFYQIAIRNGKIELQDMDQHAVKTATGAELADFNRACEELDSDGHEIYWAASTDHPEQHTKDAAIIAFVKNFKSY